MASTPDKTQINSDFNPPQITAIEHTEGPLLVIAGAGSGKTRVLTERLARILEQGLARPEEVLTVTFTNKAAGEIKNRVLKRLQKHRIYNIPWMGTFHSIAVKILRRHSEEVGLSNRFTIFDADDQLALVKLAMTELAISTRNFNPKAILGGISAAKNELVEPAEYEGSASGYFQQTVAQVYRVYQGMLRENQAVDFDDLIMLSVKLLQGVEQVRDYYQKTFKYVLVDEYQDTNHAQYLMVKLLSAGYGNLCVVGDDDQSIYAWRGATIRNILEFERDYSNATVIKLEQNYRSTQKILAASHDVVSGIAKRKPKELWTENKSGDDIIAYNALDERDEAFWIVLETVKGLEEDPQREVAVLYRMNSQSRAIEEALLKAGVPYRIVGNVRFYERKEIKDALAYLRLIYNPADELSLKRIINVPSRKIGAKTIGDLLSKSRTAGLNPVDYLIAQADLLKAGLQEFAAILAELSENAHEMNVGQLIDFALQRSGYMNLLEDGTEEGRQRLSNIKELINVASKYSELSPQASLQAFLEEVALVEAQTQESAAGAAQLTEQPRVTLLTVHSAKGLEYDWVFVAGMEEGIFPHSRAFTNTNELDEERRLAYVAITRAKHRLHLSYASQRTVFGLRGPSIPSRFLEDIDPDIVKLETFTNSFESKVRSGTGSLGDLSGFYGGQGGSQGSFGQTQGQGGFGGDFAQGGYAAARKRTFGDRSGDTNSSDFPGDSPQIDAKVGQSVRHPKFGKGRITAISDEYVTVDFLEHGEKELLLEYANLLPA